MKINSQLKDQYVDRATRFVQRLGDPRFAGQVVFVVIVLLISWSGVKAVQTNYGLQKKIAAIEQQNELQKLENTNLELANKYYESNQYLELAARQNFGLAARGEKLVVVPEKVALAHTTNLPAVVPAVDPDANKPAYQKHFEAWVDFFFHRPD